MMRRFEVNPDVLGAGTWMEIVPVDSEPPPVTGQQLRSQERAVTGDHGSVSGDHLHPWVGNWDCDGIDMLVDRLRVYQVSQLGGPVPNAAGPLWMLYP